MKKKLTEPSGTAKGVENNNTIKSVEQVSSPASIAEAIDNIHAAQEQLAAFARERAAQQLSTGSLAVISRELEQIARRMSVYVKN